MKLLKHFLLVLLVLYPAGNAASGQLDINKLIADNPEYRLESYKFDPVLPLIARVQKAPPCVSEFLRKLDGKEAPYSAYVPSKGEMKVIDGCIEGLPGHYKDVLKERLLGIYFIKDFSSSGLTNFVAGPEKKIYTYMVFNPEVLKQDISQWLTWKEQTCFINNNAAKSPAANNAADYTVKINCGNAISAFTGIFMHESTHSMDYIEGLTPWVDGHSKEFRDTGITETDFTRGTWADYSRPAGKYDYPFRGRVTFYGFNGGPKINISDAPKVYKQLSKTPFISIYGSMEWADDIAEAATFYHITAV